MPMNLNIGLSLTALAMAMGGGEPPPPGETRFVAPAVQGTGDGTSWANAAALASINTMITEAGPGGTVAIASHLGDYAQTAPIALSAAGAAGNPVTIIGMNAADEPTRPKFVGNRTAWVSPATEAGAVNAAAYGGNTLFAAAAGIGHLAFKFLRFERLGRIIDFSGITADGFLFEDCQGFNLRDGIYTNNLSAITNLVVRRCSATGFSKKFIRFHGACANWQVLDSHIDSRWQAGDNFAVGIECADTAHDLLIEGGSTVNCRDTLTSYFNGDGVVSERSNRGIHILNHASNGHTDAGYDLKSEDSSITTCIAQDNKRNFRIWGGLETPIPVVGCTSLAPHGRGGGSVHHLWVDGGDDVGSPGGRVAVDGFVASGGDEGMTAFYIDGFNSTIALSDLDITLSTGSVYKTSLATGSTITGLPGGDTAPAKFIAEQWTLAPNNNAGELALNIIGLPGSGGANISALQYRVDGGAWAALTGVGTGVRVISGLTDGVEYDIDIRAGNSVGFGLSSDVKSATPIYIEPSNIKLLFDGSDLLAGGTPVDEAPGGPALILGSTAVVVNGGIQVGGSTGDVRFPNREGFTFDGLFTVKMRFTKANWNRSAGPDFLVSFWLSTNNQRAWLIGASATNTILGGFGNGGGSSGNVVDTVANASIPVPIPAGMHELMFDRGADNYTRVYLDGVMVGKSAAPVPGTNVNNGTNFVRVTGSATGNNDPGPSILHFLEVRKGEALCGSDAGYTP